MTHANARRNRATKPWLLLALASLVWTSCAKAAPEDRLNVACVTRLQVPVYPPIATSANLSASLTVAITLANGGNVASVELENISGQPEVTARIFRPEMGRAMRGSRFDSGCDGKTVRLVFVFKMKPNGTRGPGYWFEFPNRFEIWGEAELVQTLNSSPQITQP